MDMQHFGESTLIDMSAEWLGSNIRQSSEILVNDSKQRLAFGNPAHVTLDGYSDDYTYCKWGSILLCIAPTARLLDHIWEEEKTRNDNERNKSRWILRPCSVGLEDHGQTGSFTVIVFVYTEPDSHGEWFNHNFWENVHSDGHEGGMPSWLLNLQIFSFRTKTRVTIGFGTLIRMLKMLENFQRQISS